LFLVKRRLLQAMVVAALIGLAGLGIVRLEFIQDWAFLRILAASTPNTDAPDEPDALSASVCGSRSPIPDPSRAEACVLVQAGERLFVVDVGDGSVARLRQWATPFNRIEAVMLTHLHSDHISDLADMHLATWVLQDRRAKLPVYGPAGVEQVTAGFELAYGIDYGLRNAHHGDSLAPLDVAGFDPRPIDNDALEILSEGDLKVSAFLVDHPPIVPAYGYRFDYKGRSLVISGDTKKSQAMIDNSRGVDVLFHEAQSNELLNIMINASRANSADNRAQLFEDIQTYHTTPIEAAEVANEAGVGHLVFYHLTPSPRNSLMADRLLRGVKEVRPDNWTLSVDGTRVTLPVGSDEIFLDEVD
jgi:ribonuclease Z